MATGVMSKEPIVLENKFEKTEKKPRKKWMSTILLRVCLYFRDYYNKIDW